MEKKNIRTPKIKIILLSANLFGYELLKEILKIEKAEVVAIMTLNEKSKTKMYDSIEGSRWHEFGIPVYGVGDINKELKPIKLLSPDFVIMAGWRQVINKEILDLPLKGFIGFHPALLPQGRGSAPIINTILTGLKKSGVTMFYLREGIDDGDIIGKLEFKIEKDDYAQDLYYKAIDAGKKLIKKFLPLLIRGKAPKIPQDETRATYFPRRTLKDNKIDLAKEKPEEIYAKIRAFSKPYKGAYIKLKNKNLIIWRAELKNEKEF